MEEDEELQCPQTMFARTNDDGEMYTVPSRRLEDDQTVYTPVSECGSDYQTPAIPALADIAGRNPFSSESEMSELPGVTMAKEEKSMPSIDP